ncbi:MAG: energy transducer TonB [Bdellovibrionales bacterium]|nr:energy transducer TonB [Massilia sp.]
MNFSHDKQPGKNFTGIAIVIILHVLVAYGIVTGLGKRMVTKMAEAVETKIIEEQKPPPPKEIPPPPPPPEMQAPPPPFIPPVEVNVQQPPPQQSTIAVSSAAKPVSNELARPAAPSTAPPGNNPSPVRVAASADFSTCALPEWPKASLRNEETGTVTLSFLIGEDGRVADSKIVKSSNFRDLDKAAVTGISKCRFKPGMNDGKPEKAWMSMQYVWKLD